MRLPSGRLFGEEFRLVQGFEAYCISNYGRMHSRWKRVRYGENSLTHAWMPLRLSPNRGYLKVTLTSIDRIAISKYVHVLVLETFIGPRPIGFEACHNDGVRSNNFIGNLRWGTAESNREDKLVHGMMAIPRCIGSEHGRAKLTEEEVLEIRRKYKSGLLEKELAEQYGVTRSNIGAIVTRKSWKHI